MADAIGVRKLEKMINLRYRSKREQYEEKKLTRSSHSCYVIGDGAHIVGFKSRLEL